MKTFARIGCFLVLGLVLVSCATTSQGGRTAAQEEAMPSKLTPDKEEIPVAVRAIETQIDAESVILASAAVIECSKNYQFEISLTGDVVTRDIDKGGEHDRIARGSCTAFFRNLRIQCDNGIRVRIADFGTKPYIKIRARGQCSHIIMSNEVGQREIKRANGIIIDDAKIDYIEEMPVGLLEPK